MAKEIYVMYVLSITGQKVALMNQKTLLFHMIRNFKMESIEKSCDVRPKINVVLKTIGDLRIKLIPIDNWRINWKVTYSNVKNTAIVLFIVKFVIIWYVYLVEIVIVVTIQFPICMFLFFTPYRTNHKSMSVVAVISNVISAKVEVVEFVQFISNVIWAKVEVNK